MFYSILDLTLQSDSSSQEEKNTVFRLLVDSLNDMASDNFRCISGCH